MKKSTFGNFIAAVLALLVAGVACPVIAQDKDAPPVGEIIEKSNRVSYYQGQDGRADVKMRIVDAQGRERMRQFTIIRRDSEPPADAGVEAEKFTGDQRFYVYFKAPPDVRETVFLVWKHVDLGKDDDRWLYLPDLDLVKRIAASDERTSFVGSHFFYEDVSGRNTNEDTHELVEVTETYYILDNKPKNPDLVEFSHYKMWIHRDTLLPVQVEYYDQRGEAYRRYTAENVGRPQGFLTVTKSKMEDLKTGGYTTIEYSDIEYNLGLPRDIFTERYLRKPPMQYVK